MPFVPFVAFMAGVSIFTGLVYYFVLREKGRARPWYVVPIVATQCLGVIVFKIALGDGDSLATATNVDGAVRAFPLVVSAVAVASFAFLLPMRRKEDGVGGLALGGALYVAFSVAAAFAFGGAFVRALLSLPVWAAYFVLFSVDLGCRELARRLLRGREPA